MTDFTSADLSPAQTGDLRRRTILGGLSGVAYERSDNPIGAEIKPPFVALLDFHDAWRFGTATTRGPQVLALDSVSFGTWDRSVVDGEGYFGAWFASRLASPDTSWPTTDARFSGFAVGVVGATTAASFDRLAMSSVDPFFKGSGTARGFSAEIAVEITGAFVSATISNFRVSVANAAGDVQSIVPFDLQSISLQSVSGSSPGLVFGTLSSPEGTGRFEARFFGRAGEPSSKELAGRFWFQTSDGLVAAGSFGTALE